MDNRYKEPWWKVVPADEAESLWQPLPSRGHLELHLTPDNMPYDDFSSGVQVMPPGCYIREHGHTRNHELIFIYEGQARVEIEGHEYNVGPGSSVLFGRYAAHVVENIGETDLKMFWVFMPAGLEHWHRGIGIPRTVGEEMPAAFPRPDGVDKLMEQQRFIPPKSTDK